MTIDWQREYNLLANFVGTVLDETQYMRDEARALMDLFAATNNQVARLRYRARVQALQDTLDLWENTDYV